MLSGEELAPLAAQVLGLGFEVRRPTEEFN